LKNRTLWEGTVVRKNKAAKYCTQRKPKYRGGALKVEKETPQLSSGWRKRVPPTWWEKTSGGGATSGGGLGRRKSQQVKRATFRIWCVAGNGGMNSSKGERFWPQG